MSKFTCTIDVDNAAFEDPSELPRILRGIADYLDSGQYVDSSDIRDVNGNTVGRWELA